jgi:cytochrome b subunit of formate dehydrogenase
VAIIYAVMGLQPRAIAAPTSPQEGTGRQEGPQKVEKNPCLVCHGSEDRIRKALGAPDKPWKHLVVDGEIFKRSIHNSQGCGDCHFDYDEHPHSKDAETAKCRDCHEDSAEAYDKSVHGQAREGNDKLPVSCADCHGVHDVLLAKYRESRLHPLNIYKVCGKCHFSIDPETASKEELIREAYTDDAHAHGILYAGLVVSATCISCHGGHAIRPKGDPESEVARHNVHNVCGKCHVRAVEEYRLSVHHLKNGGDTHKGATCSDCHYSHDVKEADEDFRLQTIRSCTKCHDERAHSFRKTYHGKVSTLGFGESVATCEHCHGHHLILPQSDPRSKIHPQHLVETCRSCHPKSHEEFVKYLVHVEPTDGERYPRINLVYRLMVGLIATVVILGSLHVLLWLFRSLRAKEHRLPRPGSTGGRHIRHHSPFIVGIEITSTLTTLMLASTGLPLYFSEEPWADDLMRFVGGAGTAAFLHRFAAVVLMAAFALLMLNLSYRILLKREKGMLRGPNSIIPSLDDLKSFLANCRWFLGLGPKPKFDRWTYWAKFDFWAVTWGMAIMGVSGLMLWYPEEATKIVPAWVVNAGGVVHGLEALLATVFHFSVQAFQNHLRPDRFPLDVSVFTGVISEHDLAEEHEIEYQRLKNEGRLEQMLTREPSPGIRRWAFGFGLAAVAVGLVLLAAIAFTFLSHGI